MRKYALPCFRVVLFISFALLAGCPSGEPEAVPPPRPPKKENKSAQKRGSEQFPIRVLHVTLEFPGAQVGGVAEVAGALVKNQPLFGSVARNHGHTDAFMEASVVIPWYDFLKPKGDECQRVMKVRHFFQGKVVESDVFGCKLAGVSQYLVKPDAHFRTLFDLGNSANIYSDVKGSKSFERAAYFSSAATSFAAEYRDEKSKEPFDVAHIHTMIAGLMPRIFDEVYVKKVADKQVSLPRVVYHLHSIFDAADFFAHLSSEQCAMLGLARPRGTNAVEEAVAGADHVIAASHWLAQMTLKHSRLGKFLDASRISGALNGIVYAKWQPGELRGGDNEELGFTAHNPIEGKEKIKRYLAAQGLFADPERPLIVFVGRFAKEKGVEILPAVALFAIKAGANFAIMGTFASAEAPFKLMEGFKNQEKDNKNLVVLTSLEAQQHRNLGKLLRAAADFAFVPSLSEGAGLVPQEFMCSGSLTISSGVEGLAEQLQDIGREKDPLQSGNSFIYSNDENRRVENAKQAVDRALKFYETRTKDERQAIVSRLMRSARNFDWLAQGGAIEKISQVYHGLLK